MDSQGSAISLPLWHRRNGDGDSEDVVNLSLKNFVWRYRGEGNANLVLALPREKVILRMQKCDYDATLAPVTVQEWEVKLKKSVTFYKKVMVPLLGTEFIIPPDLARISEDELADIDRTLFDFRPSFRLSKGIRLGLVTVQPDYTLLPPRKSYQSLLSVPNAQSPLTRNTEDSHTFCVEIKPKQGWVPLGDRLHVKCTFCLKQYLKLQKKRTVQRSKYCPLDLFSGNRSRMRRALEGLLETPQNNLKIFHNGNILYGEGSSEEINDVFNLFFDIKNNDNVRSTVERWCDLVLDALTREFDCGTGHSTDGVFSPHDNVSYPHEGETLVLISSISSPPPKSSFQKNSEQPCDWSCSPLPSKCILQRVLSVQKLQKSDFKTVYDLYREQSEMRGNYSYVDELFTFNNSLDEVQRYLLSATAKDCSIFIALQKSDNTFNKHSPFYIKDSEGIGYRLNIGISDIDPKPLSCIGKHYKRNEEIMSASCETTN